MVDADPDITARLAKIRQLYWQRLGETLTAITAQRDDLRSKSEWTPEMATAWAAFNAQVHQLRGSAGTFGYPDISQAAAPLDDYLSEIREKETVPDLAQWQHIDTLLARLVSTWQSDASG